MRIISLTLLLSIALISCQKSTDSTSLDYNKLVNKDWYVGGRTTPQLLTVRFNTNDTMLMTRCTWVLPPYQFDTSKHFWSSIGNDSINISGTHMRVYLLNDSVFVTNSWLVPADPALRDTLTTF